jgi:hypothetical protein
MVIFSENSLNSENELEVSKIKNKSIIKYRNESLFFRTTSIII